MIGTIAGRYKILEEIGEGGMGKVYRGEDTKLRREVAVKVLRPELVSQAHLVDRFLSEAHTLSKLNHPNIATLFDYDQHDKHFFMVMEYVRGETLDKRIKRTGLLAYDQALRIFLATLEAIGYAHTAGVVHRDIKPNNIMITESEDVKVMDFGIARVVGTERMTREGSMIGTPEYMSPEQIRGLEVDPRTDIYSLGILLYEMLTGRLPFMNQNQFELMRAHIEMPPPSPRAYAPHLPGSMEEIMLCALAKQKDDRFSSAYEFRDAILASPDLPAQALMSARSSRSGSSPITPVQLGRVSQPSQPPQQRQTVDARQFEAQQRAGTSQRSSHPAAQRSGAPNPLATPVASHTPATLRLPDEQKAAGGLPKPLLLGGGVLAALVLCVALWLVFKPGSKKLAPPPTAGGATEQIKPDMVTLPAGTFVKMGRVDEPKSGEDAVWAYLQMPQHAVTVPPFAIDRTEVSNKEYQQFIRETHYSAPEGDDWNGDEPFPGRELWPVRYVSYEDALAFAEWRSKRDKVRYRLPSEEEWEYAARNAGEATTNIFPWGDQWTPDLANLKSTGPKPVHSYPQGATKQGVLNMIGNVGEWTSTTFVFYEGNDKLAFDPTQKDNKVVRGGNYISQPDGQYPLRLTVRAPYEPKKKDPTVGFRLVRSP